MSYYRLCTNSDHIVSTTIRSSPSSLFTRRGPHLMQELAVVALHAQRAQPVAADDGAALEVLLGSRVAVRGAADAHDRAVASAATVHRVIAVVRQERLEVEHEPALLVLPQPQPEHHGRPSVRLEPGAST